MIHRAAEAARRPVADMVDRIRGSPVVFADETGWRQDGVNGFAWTFSTPGRAVFRAAQPQQAGGGTRYWETGSAECWSATSMPPTTTTPG